MAADNKRASKTWHELKKKIVFLLILFPLAICTTTASLSPFACKCLKLSFFLSILGFKDQEMASDCQEPAIQGACLSCHSSNLILFFL
jgi:hypothetical protein